MDDAFRVCGIERIRKLAPGREHIGGAHRPTRQPLAKRLALQQLHYEKLPSVMFPDVVDRADVRMIERRGGARLASKPQDGLCVLGERFRKELQGDPSSKPGVLGLIDNAHSSGT